jgi:hypothetical protein
MLVVLLVVVLVVVACWSLSSLLLSLQVRRQ